MKLIIGAVPSRADKTSRVGRRPAVSFGCAQRDDGPRNRNDPRMIRSTVSVQRAPATVGLRAVRRPGVAAFTVGGLALALTALNAMKPLQIDDTAYSYYARQAARRPLDPYGFEVFWYQYPQPANEVLAPPLLPYWWSFAVRLFGEQPVLWKLWLLPFSVLLVASLATLCHRFARGLELPLLTMTVLSPAILPSLNLMLDIPALALSLLAVCIFLRACDRSSLVPVPAIGHWTVGRISNPSELPGRIG